jgi:plastocyanin
MHSGWFRWLIGGMLAGSTLLLGVSQALAQGGPSGGWGGYGGGGTMLGGAGATTSGVPPGCGRGPGAQNVAASAIAELPRIVIGIYDDRFQPAQISVQPGTLVVWRNFGSQPHTTTSWGRWESRPMSSGESCSAWFVTPGTYDYLSIVAADGGRLTGSITVEGPPIGSGPAGMTTPGQPGTMPGTGTTPMTPGTGTGP